MSLLDYYMGLAEGNPGAAMFIGKMMNEADGFSFLKFTKFCEKYPDCRGTDLYVMYSDICGKDLDKVEKLLKDCPWDILYDACKRQDRSGRKLVEIYLGDLK